jgi:hypothetical protein
MGRLKGRTSEDQIVAGRDSSYARLNRIQSEFNDRVRLRNEEMAAQGIDERESPRKILQVDFPEEGIPLALRVGRHVQATKHVLDAYNMEQMDKPIEISGLPAYPRLLAEGLGPFIAGPGGEPPAWKATP